GAAFGEGEREVHGGRRLADAALARRDGDDVLDAGQHDLVLELPARRVRRHLDRHRAHSRELAGLHAAFSLERPLDPAGGRGVSLTSKRTLPPSIARFLTNPSSTMLRWRSGSITVRRTSRTACSVTADVGLPNMGSSLLSLASLARGAGRSCGAKGG